MGLGEVIYLLKGILFLSAAGVEKAALLDGSKSHAFCQTTVVSPFY